MTCRHAEPQLNALADHELLPWQALRVQRHLAACPACATEYAAIQRLDASVQAWRDLPTPSGLGPRIAAALPPSAAFQTRRRAFPIRPAAVGTAGIAAAVAAIFWFLPGQPGEPTIAFADVQKAMQQVQIVSWTTQYIVTDANWHPLRNQQAVHYQQTSNPDEITWLRRNPPAIATLGQPTGFIILNDARGTLQHTRQGGYLFRPISNVEKKALAGDVEGRIATITQQPSDTSSGPNHSVYSIITYPPQRQAALNGQKQILFTQNVEIVARQTPHIPEMHYFMHIFTWVNPMTHLVTRRESRNWGDKMSGQFNQRQIVVWDNFRYNQAPPSGVFDWSLPKGANVINMNDLRTDKRLRLYLPKKRSAKYEEEGKGQG